MSGMDWQLQDGVIWVFGNRLLLLRWHHPASFIFCHLYTVPESWTTVCRTMLEMLVPVSFGCTFEDALGLIWCKQFYRYDVARWLDGDPTEPPPPAGHQLVRNAR